MKNKWIAITIAGLIILIAIFAWLNAGNLKTKKELEMNAQFLLTLDGNQYKVAMQDLLTLEPVDFDAVMDTSTTDPTPVVFTGVELSRLCESLGFHISEDSSILAKGLDGYASAVTGSEALAEGNVYICIYMNGEVLKPKKQGGFGPYLMVIKNERFAQRWCKFVEEITITRGS